MVHFGSPLDGGPIDQKRVQIGGSACVITQAVSTLRDKLWTVPALVDTRLSCPIRRESEK